MKKFLAMLMIAAMALSLAACSSGETATTAAPTEAVTEAPKTEAPATEAPTTEAPATEAPTTEAPATEAPTTEAPTEPAAAVMSHAEYVAAELDTPVVVETYVQAKQSWWEDKATLYCQSEDGAYFVYNAACPKDLYDALTPGTGVRVTGFKSEWSGEVEITDATLEFMTTHYEAQPTDVTALLGKDELIDHQNEKVAFKGMTVEAANDAGDAFLYNWDGSGEEGSDLYFNVSLDGQKYTFTVESYLCGADTDVYKAVKELKVGDVIDMEGFLYWYEGANPHITSVVPAGTQSGGNEDEMDLGMTHAEYMAAELDTEVTIVTYVQAKQSWWEDKATLYCQSEDGAYFVYNAACPKDLYDALTPGTGIRVTGYKSEWSGEIEIVDATIEFLTTHYVAEPTDVTGLLGKDELIDHQNEKVTFKGMTVEAANEAGDAFLYNWDGSGEEGSDLYFNVSLNGEKYTFTVESYLCDKDSEVYQAVKNLKVGDVIDMEGFLYWYEGANPHITSVTAAK